MYRAAALTKQTNYNVNIPARPFLAFQSDDIEFIKQNLTDFILTTSFHAEPLKK